MTKYEYRIEAAPVKSKGTLEELNSLGAEGWQAVGITEASYLDGTPWCRILMMREVESGYRGINPTA
jgi:hypothetical protein